MSTLTDYALTGILRGYDVHYSVVLVFVPIFRALLLIVYLWCVRVKEREEGTTMIIVREEEEYAMIWLGNMI